jgi:hypothetical protein
MGRCGCCGGEDSSGAVRNTIVLGVSLAVSFLLLVVAAAVYRDYLPFLNIAFVVAVPMAVVVGDAMGGGSSSFGSGYTETAAAWANMGHCMFGTILASMFALPLVLLHTAAVGDFFGWVFRLCSRTETGTRAGREGTGRGTGHSPSLW